MHEEFQKDLRTVIAAIQGDDVWDEGDRTSATFLVAAHALKSTDVDVISEMTGLDHALCALYGQRARDGQIFDGEEVRGRYEGEDSGFNLLLDGCVLQGSMLRSVREDGEVMLQLSPQGKAYVEERLLPKNGGE